MAEVKENRPGEKKKKEKTSKLTEREKKILSIVKNNPEGITLPEISYITGVEFFSIIKDIKKLLNGGNIKKEKNKYFLDNTNNFK